MFGLSRAVLGVGAVELSGQLLLLLHQPEHHRLRGHRAWGQGDREPGHRTQLHLLLHVPDAGHGPHRHVLQPHAGGGRAQDANLLPLAPGLPQLLQTPATTAAAIQVTR
ncbi:hypothetical protein C0J52_20002 [Blattella germanica]|nr:hypothetical protein C0J52_20002 [Blattella germanica]